MGIERNIRTETVRLCVPLYSLKAVLACPSIASQNHFSPNGLPVTSTQPLRTSELEPHTRWTPRRLAASPPAQLLAGPPAQPPLSPSTPASLAAPSITPSAASEASSPAVSPTQWSHPSIWSSAGFR